MYTGIYTMAGSDMYDECLLGYYTAWLLSDLMFRRKHRILNMEIMFETLGLTTDTRYITPEDIH
jgi:hypothetical protein